MSLIDRVAALLMPLESEEVRMEARALARTLAQPGDWLDQSIDQHEAIERAFAVAKSATGEAQTHARRDLIRLMTCNGNAEEAIIYPALAECGMKAVAARAFGEKAAIRTEMALLEALPPLSRDYGAKLDHIRGATFHHMYEEERGWFLELREALPPAAQAQLSWRFREESARYNDRPQ